MGRRSPYDLIPPSGPTDAEAYFIGEAGGETEGWNGRPFSGKAGQVLTTYCRAAGIARSDVRINNVYPYWTGPGNPDPTAEQIAEGGALLLKDLDRVRPRIVGCLGTHAARFLLGPDVDMERAHGMPSWSTKTDALIVPIYHPAAGFYEPKYAALCQDDILQFAYYLKNPAREVETPEIRTILTKPRKRYRGGFCDTEGTVEKPEMFSWWSGDPDEPGEVVLYEPGWDPPVFEGTMWFHHALADLQVLRAMGIKTKNLNVQDTILLAYALQLEPQALKALAFRHLNLRMFEFTDVVRPHFDKVAIKWLVKAAMGKYPKSKKKPVLDYAAKSWSLYAPQNVGQRIANILTSIEKKDGTDKEEKIEKRWANLSKPTKKLWMVDSRGVEIEYELPDHQAQAIATVGEPFPEFSIAHVPLKEAVPYSGTDAVATGYVKAPLLKLVKSKGLYDVYEMDRRALRYVDRMQSNGMGYDPEKVLLLKAELEILRDAARKNIQEIVEYRWFNPGSGDQVADWLFRSKGLEPLRWTDSKRGSTDDASLAMLRGHHQDDQEVVDFVKGVQDYREADKYLGTYVNQILWYGRKTRRGWRIFPNLRITRVVSGRLSSHEPNVLAFPTRTDLGKKIRACFVAEDGHVLISCDASQIELRMMAHACRDRMMRAAFNEGKDLHAITASIIFKIAIEEIEKHKDDLHFGKRYAAKTINFAVMYGISAKALLDQLYTAGIYDFTLQDCEKFIDEWFRIFPSVQRYLESVWKKAEKDGYVSDMWGRRAYVPNIRLMDQKMRDAARRLAGNMPIQGGANGLVKWAEIDFEDWFDENEWAEEEVFPWLQIHDELLVETVEEKAEEIQDLMRGFMTKRETMLSVPMKVGSKIGRTWAECK